MNLSIECLRGWFQSDPADGLWSQRSRRNGRTSRVGSCGRFD